MAADYSVPGTPTIPPPEPSPEPAEAATEAMPKVSEITVLARQVVFVDGPHKGTIEYQVGLTAAPDPDYPASDSLDRLELAARTKLQQYLELRAQEAL